LIKSALDLFILGRFINPKDWRRELDQRGWICYAAQGVGKFVAALRLTGVGFFIGGSIALGVFAGLWADSRFNTEPILVIVGLLLGVAIAFYGVYQMLLPLLQSKQDKENS